MGQIRLTCDNCPRIRSLKLRILVQKDVARSPPLSLCLISDATYAHSTGVAIKSILRHSEFLRVLVVDAGMRDSQQEWLTSLSPSVSIVPLPGGVASWLHIFQTDQNRHVTPTTYVKAQLHNVLPDVDKVLYIDGDVIACRDVAPLLDVELGDAMIGATYNYTVRRSGRRRLGLKGDYFNAGVLLCPLKRWREQRVDAVFTGWYQRHRHLVKYDDQDVFNAIFDGKVKWIDKRWNVSQTEVLSTFFMNHLTLRDTWMLHFNGGEKPWNPGYHRRWGLNERYYREAMNLIAPYHPEQGRNL
ncbi:MAG: glycosyltransferase [Rhodocyclaceae bacterium]